MSCVVRRSWVISKRLVYICIYFRGNILAELVVDNFCVCISRLECPFDTAVELAAFSLQGKLTGRIPLPTGVSSMSCNCLFRIMYVGCYLLS